MRRLIERRLITLSVLLVTLAGGTSIADHGRGRGRDRGPVVRDHRDRDDRRTVRDNRRDNRRRYEGPIRANRRVVDRRPIYVSNGRFVFQGGVSRTYTRPVIRQRYFDVRIRPQIIVESYPAQAGYIWVTGQWSWAGNEWTWVSGHYEADPSFSVYYDDGSWE
ncbi:MAG: repeat (2 copies) [Deltaproteobacteria bacterium]|nr:repeat (2 copies) [Deltaproteobacteria bacterium]